MMLVVLAGFLYNARNLPLAEDWLLVPMLTGNEPNLMEWLWAQNNEHRVPLPKAILMALLRLSGGDFRAGMLFNIAIIGATAAAAIMVARSVRGGRTRLTDVFFPVLLLHLGHWENLYWGWQLTQILPTLLAIAMLLVLVRYRDLAEPRAAAVACATLLMLPLCGANGLMFVPLPALWIGYRGVEHLRTSTASRAAGVAMTGCAVLALALCAAYFIDYRRPDWLMPNPGVVPSLTVAAQFLAFGLGPAVQRAWGPAAAFSAGVMLVAGVVAVRALWTASGPERSRAIGVLLFVANTGAFVLAIGWGRAGALDVFGYWPLRYVLMAAVAFCAAYLVAELYAAHALRRTIQLALAAIVVLLVPLNTLDGGVWGRWYRGGSAALERDIAAGLAPAEVARRHREFLIHWWDAPRLAEAMRMLEAEKLGMFARLAVDSPDTAASARAAAPAFPVDAGVPLVRYDLRYQTPGAGRVWLVWGVGNDWQPIPDSLRPPGTVIANRVMRTPMGEHDGEFRAELRAPKGVEIAYGFLTTHRADGLEVRDLWDGDGYRVAATRDTVVPRRAAEMLESEKSRAIRPWLAGLAIIAIGWAAVSLGRRRHA
jgi:hypothetical protein